MKIYLKERADASTVPNIFCGLSICLAVLFLLPGVPSLAKGGDKLTKYGEIVVRARPIEYFQNGEGDKHVFGRLKWRGGLSLLSTSPVFGGISGLSLDRNGKNIIAVTDQGTWMTGEIIYDGVRPKYLHKVIVGPLRARNGQVLKSKRNQDAEGLELINGTSKRGTALISFERNHRIGRFPITSKGIGKPTGYLKLPKGLRGVTRNKGLEAITIIKKGRYKGRVLTFAERKISRDGHLQGWILSGKKSKPLLLKRIGGFDVTDLASLPSGDIIVLERRFNWSEGIHMRLRLIPVAALASRRVIKGEILLEADGGYAIDNMEGLALHQTDKGKTVITLISDDNFSILQRTLLLQFELLASQTPRTKNKVAAQN